MNDLRELIVEAQKAGEVRRIEGADWDLEIGLITEIEAQSIRPRLLLFDRIKGYQPGFRVATNLFNTSTRIALAFGLPKELKGLDLVRAFKGRLDRGVALMPPSEAATCPVMENIFRGKDVDITSLPVPRWHKDDGGRYIGTNAVVITREPDEGWINAAPYRVQVHSCNTATISVAPGHHGDLIRRKYWARGDACPVAVSCGQEPLLFAASDWPVPWGTSELDFAGGLKGEPISTVRGPVTGLPIPATAEIVLEGELLPPEKGTLLEGPFGEWTGYYAGGGRPEAVFQVHALLHRNQPILQGAQAMPNPAVWTLGRHIWRSALVWSELERQVPGVQAVWVVGEAGINSIIAASIKQLYPGHAKQTLELLSCLQATATNLRYCVVVDEDIDPSNTAELIWAIGTRTDPAESIDVVRHTRAVPTNTMLPPEKREIGDLTHSTAQILAVRPYHWKDRFPKVALSDPNLLRATREKWAELWE